jgi:hypothetical protein
MAFLLAGILLTAFAAGATDFELTTLNHTLSTNLLTAGPSAANNAATYTATLSITNGPVDGAVLSVNGTLITWKTTVTQQSVQVATNPTPAIAATNLYNHLLLFPVTGLSPSWASATSFTFTGTSGPITITNTTAWLSTALATNSVTLTGAWLRVENKRYHTVHITQTATNTVWLDRSLDATNFVTWFTNGATNTIEAQATGEWSYLRARAQYTNGTVSVQYLGGR